MRQTNITIVDKKLRYDKIMKNRKQHILIDKEVLHYTQTNRQQAETH